MDAYHLSRQISEKSTDAFKNNETWKDMLEFYEKNIITRAYKKYKTTIKVAEKLGTASRLLPEK